jgi:hypothetical protein
MPTGTSFCGGLRIGFWRGGFQRLIKQLSFHSLAIVGQLDEKRSLLTFAGTAG